MKRRKRRLSRKQLAALAKGRAALKKLRNPKRRQRHASRKVSRARRRSRLQHKNPSGIGELAIMSANPKKHRRSRKGRRHRRSRRSLSLFRNPGGAVLAAVTSGPKELVKADLLKDALAVSAGFLAPNKVLMRLPASMINAPWKAYASKVGLIVGGAALAGKFFGPRAKRGVLIGGAVSLAVDLFTDYVEPMISGATSPAPAPQVSAYFGRRTELGLDAYYGRELAGLASLGGSASPAGVFEDDV